MKNKLCKWQLLNLLYIIVAIAFSVPSCIYLIKNKTVVNFNSNFRYLLNDDDKIKQAIIYMIIMLLLVAIYLIILKLRNKIFKNIKSVFIFIFICSLIFVVILPMFSSDIFYYLGIGRLNSEYGQNPYYISMKEFTDNNINIDLTKDTTLYMGYINAWGDTTVVYGPIWTMICAIVAKASLGDVNIGLFIFKILNLIFHMINCYYIYKISKKKLFVLIYGLNPLIIIESIVNVHNDVFMILFILLSLYELIKKKNIWLAIFFLAISACIKYFSIIFLPFMVIYYFRKEKVSKRILKCIEFGIYFLAIVAIPYLVYIKDVDVFSGLWIQQAKYSKSIGVIIFKYCIEYLDIIGKLLYVFIFFFVFNNILLIKKKNILLRKEIQILFYFVFIFLFVLITNFQPWYVMWLFPLMMWQRPKNIRLMIQITIIMLFDYMIFMVYEDHWKIGANFAIVYLSFMGLFILINNIKRIKRYIKKRKEEKNENISCR